MRARLHVLVPGLATERDSAAPGLANTASFARATAIPEPLACAGGRPRVGRRSSSMARGRETSVWFVCGAKRGRSGACALTLPSTRGRVGSAAVWALPVLAGARLRENFRRGFAAAEAAQYGLVQTGESAGRLASCSHRSRQRSLGAPSKGPRASSVQHRQQRQRPTGGDRVRRGPTTGRTLTAEAGFLAAPCGLAAGGGRASIGQSGCQVGVTGQRTRIPA
jgi:hypothetical protein